MIGIPSWDPESLKELSSSIVLVHMAYAGLTS